MTERAGFPAGWAQARRAPMQGDASTRRYTRLRKDRGATAILMEDADCANLERFLTVAAYLRACNLSSPAVLAARPEHGWALLEDLGSMSLAELLRSDPQTAGGAYARAAEIPDVLLGHERPPWAAAPDATAQAEMVRLTFNLAGQSVDAVVSCLSEALAQHAGPPMSLSLRDYHGDNLIWMPDRPGVARIGLLDFQDAVLLPLGYDLASLVDDPRRDVPQGWRHALIAQFAARHGLTETAATARINTLSALRNLRILGVFHRLATTHGRPAYRAFLPRTWALISRALEDPCLQALRPFVEDLRPAVEAWAP